MQYSYGSSFLVLGLHFDLDVWVALLVERCPRFSRCMTSHFFFQVSNHVTDGSRKSWIWFTAPSFDSHYLSGVGKYSKSNFSHLAHILNSASVSVVSSARTWPRKVTESATFARFQTSDLNCNAVCCSAESFGGKISSSLFLFLSVANLSADSAEPPTRCEQVPVVECGPLAAAA